MVQEKVFIKELLKIFSKVELLLSQSAVQPTELKEIVSIKKELTSLDKNKALHYANLYGRADNFEESYYKVLSFIDKLNRKLPTLHLEQKAQAKIQNWLKEMREMLIYRCPVLAHPAYFESKLR